MNNSYLFENHRLTINADKTEFILSCKPSKNNDVKSYKLHVKDQLFKHSNSVKYLGFFIDQNLTFQNEVKKYFAENELWYQTSLLNTRSVSLKNTIDAVKRIGS